MALLKLRNIHPRTHSGLISEFGLNFVKDGTIEEDYARYLVKAETKRVMADYDVIICLQKKRQKKSFMTPKSFWIELKKQ
jgi:uncharacterized protein (UPF0332 family)